MGCMPLHWTVIYSESIVDFIVTIQILKGYVVWAALCYQLMI